MKNRIKTAAIFAALCFAALPFYAGAQDQPKIKQPVEWDSVKVLKQTASSLFWRSDSLQVSEIVSEEPVQYKKVGHHGPAVENPWSMFRLYFNDSGAIDVYSKSGRGMELLQYKWYPTDEQREKFGAGIDQYTVGKTVGLGGVALWDGENEVKLVATKGRTARVGETEEGSFAEIIAYGVLYKGEYIDVSERIDVNEKEREATVTATVLGGQRVQFISGVNFHEGEEVAFDERYIAVWGVHPPDVAKEPEPVGAGLFYSPKHFPTVEKLENMVRIISREADSMTVRIVAASTLEEGLNTAEKFMEYMANGKPQTR
ncbi:MAG: DUF4861 domain-containing protein [Bacteroidales bacterium]|nr:DUF4861 domain-containing protein [Bacteroidales bacterium]